VRTQCSSCPSRHLPRRRPPRRLCPPTRGWHSFVSAVKAYSKERKKSWARRVGGKLTYITCQKQDTWVRLVKNLTLRGSRWEPRSLPREEKSTSPYLMYIYYKLLNTTKEKTKRTTETQTTTAAHGDFRRSTSEACPHSKCKALLRRSTNAT
jgi:hypothetical protein